MQRNFVQVARIRIREIVPGDVVNRLPDETRGWFVAALIEDLFDGTISISDATRAESFSGGPLDIVGVQTTKLIDLPVTETIPEIEDVMAAPGGIVGDH
jgi:hypothetical protein